MLSSTLLSLTQTIHFENSLFLLLRTLFFFSYFIISAARLNLYYTSTILFTLLVHFLNEFTDFLNRLLPITPWILVNPCLRFKSLTDLAYYGKKSKNSIEATYSAIRETRPKSSSSLVLERPVECLITTLTFSISLAKIVLSWEKPFYSNYGDSESMESSFRWKASCNRYSSFYWAGDRTSL